MPDTIQEVILSRIDRLEREGKEAIQLASVIGREFTVRLLQRISDVQAEARRRSGRAEVARADLREGLPAGDLLHLQARTDP